LEVAEVQTASGELDFPYIPGFLSFREIPLVIKAFEKLTTTPNLVLVDGQGFAHPRRIGFASHLGLFLGIPTIGCAKSRLIGEFETPGVTRGSFTDLTDGSEVVGAVVRTKDRVKPLFISIGNMINLDGAVKWTLDTCKGYRLPEPTRLAHLAAGGNLKI
jgi:deoxyribonuclease V